MPVFEGDVVVQGVIRDDRVELHQVVVVIVVPDFGTADGHQRHEGGGIGEVGHIAHGQGAGVGRLPAGPEVDLHFREVRVEFGQHGVDGRIPVGVAHELERVVRTVRVAVVHLRVTGVWVDLVPAIRNRVRFRAVEILQVWEGQRTAGRGERGHGGGNRVAVADERQIPLVIGARREVL